MDNFPRSIVFHGEHAAKFNFGLADEEEEEEGVPCVLCRTQTLSIDVADQPFEVETGRIVCPLSNPRRCRIFRADCVRLLGVFTVRGLIRWEDGIRSMTKGDHGKFGSMCDPTALLDLVPSEGLLKRPSMDYNEYTYCYGGGRGGWYSSLAAAGSSCVVFQRTEPVRAVGRTCRIFSSPARHSRQFLSTIDPTRKNAGRIFLVTAIPRRNYTRRSIFGTIGGRPLSNDHSDRARETSFYLA